MWTSWAESLSFKDGKLYFELGPMRLTVIAEKDGKPCWKAVSAAVSQAVQALCEVAENRRKLSRPAVEIDGGDFPEVVRRMVEACRATGDETLTPMAAVAGAISDLAAEAALKAGAEKVVVENRGDIAVRFAEGFEGSATIGVKTSLQARNCRFLLEVKPESGIGGVATSGLEGMGLTLGIADAAVAAASTGALADACSTLLGNHTLTRNIPVERRKASELDPSTDIPSLEVTVRVGRLTWKQRLEAVENGMREASRLMARGSLLGALIVVGECWKAQPPNLFQPVKP